MPLVKKNPETVATVGTSEPITLTVTQAKVHPIIEGAKTVYTGRKASSDTMSKEDWANKDKRISLQGLVQALLQSVNFGQYVVTTTPEEFLSAVEQASLRLAKFVAENGK